MRPLRKIYDKRAILDPLSRDISRHRAQGAGKIDLFRGIIAVRFGLKFSTSRPTDSVESWLERLCQSRFEIRLDGVDVENGRKDLLLVFEDAGDRDRVKAALKGRAA